MSDSWADKADQAEIPLGGGDVTEGVVRVGNTVRRPVGPHSPLVHALLAHLESVGFVPAGATMHLVNYCRLGASIILAC